MVAQVKMHMVPIGRPDLQRLYGVAVTEGAVSVFFSLTDYTREAKDWADQVGMALFRFSPVGEAEPVNGYAEMLVERARIQAPRPPEPPLAGAPIGCSDEAASRALIPPRWSFRQVDRVLWVRQGWLPVASLIYDCSYYSGRVSQGRPPEVTFGRTRAACQLLTGRAIGVPPWQGQMLTVHPDHINLKPAFTPEDAKRQVERDWDYFWDYRHSSRRAPSRVYQEAESNLVAYGVPPDAVSLDVAVEGVFALPFFAALVTGPTGNRVTAVEGVTGTSHSALGRLFTILGPQLLDQLYAGRPVAE
jgi:hypothetical protein